MSPSIQDILHEFTEDAPPIDEAKQPQSLEAEQSVLGGILTSTEVLLEIIGVLDADDFYRTAHKLIFEAVVYLFDKSEPVDIISVSEVLSDRGHLEIAGGRQYINDLALSVITTANVAYHAKIVKNKALLRGLLHAGQIIASHAFTSNEASESLDKAQSLIFKLAQLGMPVSMSAIREILPDSYAQIEERFANKGSLMGVATGFYDLDNMTSGLQKSDLIILAARPSMGKTAFCLNILTHVALRESKPVLMFSLEMGKEQLVLRMLCAEAEIDAQRVRTGELTEPDFMKISTAMGKLGDAPIYIDDTPGLSVMDIRARARKLQMEHRETGGIGLIIIDYLQLMEDKSFKGGENRTQEIAAISRGLKGIARELKVPVIALSQLSRAVESRQDKKPMLSDLRESGSIEQDADIVMFIYRDEYYNPETDRPGTADIIIAKQRNGPVGSVELLFRNSITRFLNPYDRKPRMF